MMNHYRSGPPSASVAAVQGFRDWDGTGALEKVDDATIPTT